MKCCQGVWHKVVFIPLSTLVLGWIVYLVGFCLTITSDEAKSSSKFDYIAHYISVATPLLVVLLASLHAALFGCLSSILGLLAALLSVFCFPAVGYVLYTDAIRLYAYSHGFSDDSSLDAKSVVSFVGCFLMCVSWTAVLLLWNCFTYKDAAAIGEEDNYAVDEEGTMDPPPPVSKDPPYFAGVARKLAVVFLVLQLGCWCLFVAGIDSQVGAITSLYDNVPEIFFNFDMWAVSTLGLFLIISAFIHAAARGTSSIQIGAFTYLISMVYLICLGHLVFSLAIAIYHQCVDQSCSITTFPKFQLYQISGGVGTGVFWGCAVGLWPFFFKSVDSTQTLRIRIRQQRRYLFQNQNERIPLYQSTGSNPTPSAPHL